MRTFVNMQFSDLNLSDVYLQVELLRFIFFYLECKLKVLLIGLTYYKRMLLKLATTGERQTSFLKVVLNLFDKIQALEVGQ